MARQLAEGRVALVLVALAAVCLLSLLGLPGLGAVAAAIALATAGLVLAFLWPRGNRLLGFGVAGLGVLLAAASYLDAAAIARALAVLAAALLLATAWLKRQGRPEAAAASPR